MQKQNWVAKFGGTSVANHEAMTRCANIINDFPNVRVVVVSAPAGVTNLLVRITQSHMSGEEISSLVSEIKNKITHIVLAIKPSLISAIQPHINHLFDVLEKLANQLKKEFNLQTADELLSLGERFSACLFACVLQEQGFAAKHVDARQLVKTSNFFGKAEVLVKETKVAVMNVLLPEIEKNIIVVEGFIGSTLENLTTTLGRGGSDYSAAIIAEAMQADVLQIWTDVTGIYTVDPRLVPHAKPIDNICFTEAAELAQFGAKVLHPATLWPAIRKNIPVFVGSSIDPKSQGTWIRAQYPDQVTIPLIRAIALRKNQSILTIHSLEMLHTHGFLANVFSILAKHKLSVDLVTTSEVNVALTLNHSENTSVELLTPEVLAELKQIGNVELTIDKNLALIGLIGNNLHLTSGVSGRVFNLLRDFNIRLICHGASSHNLCFLVNEKDAQQVIQRIHAEFFESI